MNPLKKLLTGATDSTSTVIIKESCSVGGVHRTPGEEVSLSPKDAKLLIDDGRAYDPAEESRKKAQQKTLESLIPPREEEEPLPDSWKSLTKSFMKWWKLAEKRRVIVKHQEQIEKEYIKLRSPYLLNPQADVRGVPEHLRAGLISAAAMSSEIGAIPPERVAELNHLRAALQKTNEELSAWSEKHREEVTKLWIECGDHLQDAYHALARVANELQEISYSIFHARAEKLGLGLGERALKNLFNGSADREKYWVEKSTLNDLRLAYNDGSSHRLYVDKPVMTIAHLFMTFTDRKKELETLLEAAKKDLKAAQKVA